MDKPFGGQSNFKYELWVDFTDSQTEKLEYFKEKLAGLFNSEVKYSSHSK